MAYQQVKFPMKVLIDKEKNKVIFAEVNGDLADVLISFLTLPLGTMVRLLMKQHHIMTPIIGSLSTLYKSLENLDASSFWMKELKLMLLNPKNPFEAHLQKLGVKIDDTEATEYFYCSNSACRAQYSSIIVSIYHAATKCFCGAKMTLRISRHSSNEASSGVFVEESASFIITDELHMFPNMVGTGLQILKNLGVKESNGLEEKTISVGYQEVTIFGAVDDLLNEISLGLISYNLSQIIGLLRGSLTSMTPLTDLVNKKTPTTPVTVKYEPGFAECKNFTTSMSSKKMTLKAIVQKSTGRILLAQTNEDFVDFLFSLLTIPLGAAFFLLGDNIFQLSIYNLYSSLKKLNNDRFLKIRDLFYTPQVAPKYVSKHQFFSLSEQSTPTTCYTSLNLKDPFFHVYMTPTKSTDTRSCSISLKDPKCQESFVKGPAIFLVTDDLVVKPTSAISCFSIINDLKIPLSDIEDYVITIGRNEALSILKASLFSTSVLNNSIKPLLKREPKTEK